MRALVALLSIAPLLLSSGAHGQFASRYAGHEAWADYHISSLPPEMKANVLGHRRACGTPFAATHAFARPTRFRAPVVVLHYEVLWCAARGGGICKGEDCLHEVYIRNGSRYRLSFRGYVRDVRVDLDGTVTVIRDRK